MKKTSRKLNIILILSSLLVLMAIGGTAAYYSASMSMENRISVGNQTQTYSLVEKFKMTDKWLPGETIEKKPYFWNQGTDGVYLRLKFTGEWDNGNLDPGYVKLNYPSYFSDDWIDKDDGYYYYKKILNSSNKTNPILDSLTFKPEATNDGNGNDYSGRTYTLIVNVDYYEASAGPDTVADLWGKTPSESDGVVTWS